MFTQWITTTVSSFIMLMLILGPLIALELAFPKSPAPFLSRLQGLTFLALGLPFFSLAQILLFRLFSPSPLAIIDLTRIPFQPVTGLLCAAVLGDFWFYWMHRIQHKFFWRFHSVHHSIENLSAISSYHHISEALFQTIFRALPAALLFQRIESAWLLTPILWVQGLYLHSSMRIHLGPLRYIVGDNRFHRIHHSTDPAHFNKNFSAFSPVWDVLFRTAYFPKPSEWPACGLSDHKEVSSTFEWLVRPFRNQ